MRPRLLLLTVLLAGLSASGLLAQVTRTFVVGPTGRLLAASRQIDWTFAGAGTIPTTRTQCGSTLASTSTVAQINTAISNCGANQYVLLGNGTFSLAGGGPILIQQNNVTLRGGGPDQTILKMTGATACTVYASHICASGLPGSSLDGSSAPNVMTLAGGYSVGSTSLTIGNGFVTGSYKPVAGNLLILDQIIDATLRANDTWPADFECVQTAECRYSSMPDNTVVDARGSGTTARGLFQIVTVTTITGDATCSTGCTVTISPPIQSPDWKSSLTPQAWWASSPPIVGVGIENLTVEHDTPDAACGSVWCSAIGFEWARASWVKNIKITGELLEYNGGVDVEYSEGLTVRDSYVFLSNTKDDYGIDPRTVSALLVENNIFQHTRTPMVVEAGNGFVIAYNYTIATYDPTANWSYGGFINHGNGGNFWLLEGNDTINWEIEDVHGALRLSTAFRNRFNGRDSSSGVNQTVPGFQYELARFNNYVGNVLGTSGYHTQYQTIAGGSVTNCNVSIYALGLGGDCLNGGTGGYPANDPHVADSIFRWGNWDVVTNAVRWCGNASNTGWSTTCGSTSEVPTGLTNFANLVPSTQTLPNSLYLSGKPTAVFSTTTWPPIGPEVTGGDVTNVGGHVYRIPARSCFEDVMGGLYGDTTSKTFNASTCYPR